MTIPTILEDDREIEVITWDDGDGSQFMVDHSGVTAIRAYGENCEYPHYVPWLAVYKGDQIVARVPAAQVVIGYKNK